MTPDISHANLRYLLGGKILTFVLYPSPLHAQKNRLFAGFFLRGGAGTMLELFLLCENILKELHLFTHDPLSIFILPWTVIFTRQNANFAFLFSYSAYHLVT